MILLKPSYKIETPIDGENGVRMLKLIELAARTCYKSEGKITDTSYHDFVRKIVQVIKHESVIEHGSITVRLICDRGVSHEQVRHRLASYSQESTRYVDYSDDKKTEGHCKFIIPPWCKELPEGMYVADKLPGNWRLNSSLLVPISDSGTSAWLKAMNSAEDSYIDLRKQGWAPEQARSVLPNSTKTEIVVSANPREWRHILRMRTSSKAHPQIREIMCPLLAEFKLYLPELFDDIEVK